MTIKEIAKLAGVSISTVSKIINGKDEHINAQTRSRVLQIVKEYNFTPYGSLKSATPGKSFLLGVLLRSTVASSLLLNGIISSAQKNGYSILLLESQDDPELEYKQLTVFFRNHVDGILWEPICQQSISHTDKLEHHKIPWVLINTEDHPSAFQIDYELLGLQLTKHLAEKKHTKIACFLDRHHPLASSRFLKGFKKCLYEHQILSNDELLFDSLDKSFIQKLIQYEITGAVCMDMQTTYALYELLTRHHYQIPSDFSLITLSEYEQKDCKDSLLSCLSIPFHDFGSYVCMELIRLCERKQDSAPELLFSRNCSLTHEKSLSQPLFLQKKSFISVGSIHQDISFNVNTLPQAGSTLKIHNVTNAIGGKGVNQAVGIARLGYPVHLIGAVGNDLDAAFILNALKKEHVSTSGICRNRRNLTGKAYIYTETDGESAVTVLSGANDTLTCEDIEQNQSLFANACFCLLSSEIPIQTILAAGSAARKNRVTTILKPSTLTEMPEELYRFIDILVPNRKEAAALCPGLSSVERQAEFFFRKGIPTVIITLGHEGCYLKTAELSTYFPAVRLEAVDATGGADAFIAALASYLFEGYPLIDAIKIATAAAAFCVSRQGGAASMIDRHNLETYLEKTMPHLIRTLN